MLFSVELESSTFALRRIGNSYVWWKCKYSLVCSFSTKPGLSQLESVLQFCFVLNYGTWKTKQNCGSVYGCVIPIFEFIIRFRVKNIQGSLSQMIPDEAIHGMMTSSNENNFLVTDPWCVEFTSHRWIPLAKASDAGLWCFIWAAPEQMVEQSWWRCFDAPSHSSWRHCNGPIHHYAGDLLCRRRPVLKSSTIRKFIMDCALAENVTNAAFEKAACHLYIKYI